MILTDRAQGALNSYLAEVRAAMAGHPPQEVEEIVAGVREHVEIEADVASSGNPATAEQVDAIIERLGGPEQWTEQGRPAGSNARSRLVPAYFSVGLGVSGFILVLDDRLPEIGIFLLVAGAVLARISQGESWRPDGALETLLYAYWRTAHILLLAILLLGPAILVWGQGQIGGVFEAVATSHGAIGFGAIIGAVTGAWLLVLALAAFLCPRAAKRLTNPIIEWRPASAGWLGTTGLALFALSGLLFVLK